MTWKKRCREAELTCRRGYGRIYLCLGISSWNFSKGFYTYVHIYVCVFLLGLYLQVDNHLPPRPYLHPNICTQHVRDICVSLKTAPLAIVTCLTHCMLLLYICRSAPAFPCRVPDNQIFAFFTRAPPSLPRLTCWISALWIIDRRSDGLWGACLCLKPPPKWPSNAGVGAPCGGRLNV